MVLSYRPVSYADALSILTKVPVTIIAGGTDLMVKKRSWSNLAPTFDGDVMFVGHLEEISYIKKLEKSNQKRIHIGATITLEELLYHKDTPEILRQALGVMASPAIRHTATLAGNIGNASPAGDSLPVLYILNAIVVLASSSGERQVPIEDFILGPGKTAINSDEMIKEIIIDDCNFGTVYYKKVGGRKADAISKVCFAGCGSKVDGQITDMRVAFGAVGPTVVRVRSLEEACVNAHRALQLSVSEKPSEDGLVEPSKVNFDQGDESSNSIAREQLDSETVKKFADYVRPIDDQRSNAIYRKQIALNLLKDFITKL
ncbi:MAG: FAD binding domain-containing protein [Vallitaleaceae bacterium]|jgi:xanthine dehydrogenase FAD-binding subunit|nr:FAD binding domain-containing protein [Vallitaleaceae bacterium]